MTLVRLYIFAFLAALSLSLGGALPDAAQAKPAAAKTAKGKAAKKPAAGKGKASTATKGKGAKAAKGKDGKDGKAAKGKAVKGGKDAKATKPAAKTAAEKPGIKGKKSLKPPKPQPAKGKFAAKPAPVEDLDEEFEGEEEEAETSSGPWLIVFVLFVLVCVGVFVYMKKKNAAQGAREDFHYQSSPEQAFGSNLSSLDLDKKKRKDKDGFVSEDTDPNGGGGGGGGGGGKKKTSWKESLLGKIKSAGSGIKDKAKGAAAQAAKNAASNVAGEVAGGLGGGLAESVGGAIGGDAVGALAGDLAANAAGNAASKAVSKKLDKKLAKPAAAEPEPASQPVASSSGGALGVPLPVPGNKTAHAEPSVHLMNAKAATHAPGATFANDASADQLGAGSFDEDRPLTAAEWCGWDKLDPEEFWYRIYDVEAGGIESDEAFDRRMAKYGFKGKSHFDRVKEAYLAKTPAAHETQVMMNARMRQGKEAMQASAAQNAHLFEPIEGVSLETYAKIMSRKGRLTTNDMAAVEAIYKEFGVTTAQFDKANAGWQDRMSNQKDPATIGALMGEYSKHFAAGSSGKFAGAANAGAAAADRSNVAGIGQDPSSAEPCTLERYIEIQSAQKIWAEQGQDIGANFQKFFGISIMDFSDLGQYWSPRIHANTEWITSGKIQKLMDKYEAMYRSKAA